MISKTIRLNGLDLIALLGEDFIEGGTLTIIDGAETLLLDLDTVCFQVDVGDDFREDEGDQGEFDDAEILAFNG